MKAGGSGAGGRGAGEWVGGWVGGVRLQHLAMELGASQCAEVLLRHRANPAPCCAPSQEVAEKETIAGELAAAEPRLVTTHRGPLLLRRCHVDAYKKGSEGWQQRVVAADAARREFEDLFGEAEAAGAGGAAEGAAAGEEGGAAQAEEGGKAKKAKKAKKAAAAAAAEEVDEQAAAGSGKKSKKKRQQQQEAEAAAADEQQQQQQQQQEEQQQQQPGGGGSKAKKLKKRDAEPQVAAAAVDDIMAQLGERGQLLPLAVAASDAATLLCLAGSGCLVAFTVRWVLTVAVMCPPCAAGFPAAAKKKKKKKKKSKEQ